MENPNYDRKLKFCQKIEILTENRNFSQKSKLIFQKFVRNWKKNIFSDRDHFDFVLEMLTMPHSIPINPRQLAMEYD